MLALSSCSSAVIALLLPLGPKSHTVNHISGPMADVSDLAS